ncbi:hypothetical protein AB0C33_40640 [Nonomuraea sp. NPDC048881]|uniref:hypothetical protein n=1 Tax=Nonomuraea sp. NPDC048881 TaxID=3155030 RepID=UPI0033C6914D
MTTTLGHQRYGAFGGDIGGSVTQWLRRPVPGRRGRDHMTSGSLTAGIDSSAVNPDERIDRGGHFMAHEEPDYLADQLRPLA